MTSDDGRLYHIIYNPYANRGGSKAYLDGFTAILARHGLAYAVHETKTQGDATKITQDLIADGARQIIIMGGDGTIHEVLNGYAEGDDVIFGIIPAGTGNDVAATLGIPSALAELDVVAADILAGRVRSVDMVASKQGEQSMLFFSYGIAAQMILEMQKMKGRSKLSYYKAMLKQMVVFKPGLYQVEFDGQTRTIRADFCGVHNCVYAGGGMKLINDAMVDDGYAELFMVENRGFVRRVLNFAAILRGRMHKQPNVEIVKVRHAVIASPDDPLCCIDGENHEFAQLELEVRHGAVRIFGK